MSTVLTMVYLYLINNVSFLISLDHFLIIIETRDMQLFIQEKYHLTLTTQNLKHTATR